MIAVYHGNKSGTLILLALIVLVWYAIRIFWRSR